MRKRSGSPFIEVDGRSVPLNENGTSSHMYTNWYVRYTVVDYWPDGYFLINSFYGILVVATYFFNPSFWGSKRLYWVISMSTNQ